MQSCNSQQNPKNIFFLFCFTFIDTFELTRQKIYVYFRSPVLLREALYSDLKSIFLDEEEYALFSLN